MAIWHKEVTSAIDTVVENPDIVALYRRWCELQALRGGLPALDDFSVAGPQAPLAALAPRMMHLEVTGGDFVYRHYGTEIRQYGQIDMTGRTVADFGGDAGVSADIGRYFIDGYRRVASQRQPLYTLHVSDWTQTVYTWERLILPVQDETGRDWLVVYNRPVESRAQLLEAALNTASDAILVLRSLYNADALRHEWIVAVANERFAQIAGASIADLTGHLVHEVLPQWDEFGFEAECRAALGMPHGHQRDVALRIGGASRWFSAYIGPLLDGCVVRLSDITTVKHNEQKLQANAQRLQTDNARLQQLAWLDGLTGLSNRRAFDVILEREMARARRNGTPLTLGMCDIDHFKAYNDFYGHLAGDDCIREVASVLASTGVRAADLVARYGGEEFVLVMPDTTLEGGLEVVRRAQQALRERALPDATSPNDKVLTLSFGLAQFKPALDTTGATLIGRADAALYRAKHQGRNRIATEDPTT